MFIYNIYLLYYFIFQYEKNDVMVLYSIEKPVFARVFEQHHRKMMVLNGVVKMGNGVVFRLKNGGFAIFKRLVTMLQKY